MILNSLLAILLHTANNRWGGAEWFVLATVILIGISCLVFFNARHTKEAFPPIQQAGA